MSLLLQDLRHAVRTLLKRPQFAVTAVLTLALGIGGVTATFSVVYGVLLKPLPFDEPERLVGVYHRAPGLNLALLGHGRATYFTYRDNSRVFEDIGAWDSEYQISITGRGEPENVEALFVTDGTLPLLRVQPALGRFFSREDDAPGSPPRVVLSHGFWQRKLGGTQDVIGQSLEVDGTPHEVIGVLPRSFKFLRTDPAVLLPMQLDRSDALVGSFDFLAVARLKPGVSLSEADADVARMMPLLFERFPSVPGFTRQMWDEARVEPNVRPLSEDVVGNVSRLLWILLGMVSIVLLIASANVANLSLVRAEGRQHELAVRAALGASRGSIARELLVESLVLGLAGGALGLLFSRAGIGLLARMAPSGLPRVDEIGIDPAVLLFALVISVLTGLMFGLVPILRFGTPNVAVLKEGGRWASDAPGRHRIRGMLVVSQVALAFVLLIVSGLMIRTFVALLQVDPGFVRPQEVQTFRVAVPERRIRDPEQVARTHEQIAERLQQVPGVVSVGLSSSITMDGEDNANPLFVEHVHVAGDELPPLRRFKYVAPGYVEVMGNRLVTGRTITWADIHQAKPVAVISENLAREYWREPSVALGNRIRSNPENQWREIVGVVGNERDDGLGNPAPTIVYWPMLMKESWDEPPSVSRTMAYAVRSNRVGSPGFLHELQQAVWSVNPSLPLAGVQTLDEIRADSMAQISFALVMLAIAAGVALLLGVVGIYGVIVNSVVQRTREIGIRMALGATSENVVRLVVQQGLFLTALGVALGLAGALAVTRLTQSLLYGVTATDPVTFLVVPLVLVTAAMLACFLPARRASRVDPMIALRAE